MIVLPIVNLVVRINLSADALGIAREPRGKINNELFKRTVFLVVAEIGHRHRDGACARFAVGCAQSSGVCASVGFDRAPARKWFSL
ncbi:hypothetical protein [Bradyrhizobium canariense]|uniref:hypothetical protein n=1 Tax=Bradyrhizobium canariense TaxID=255045 RepID=UPI00143030AF|nr:hypothetical protein [Bradyrhizobium canariense]